MINIITKKPSNKTQGVVEVGIGHLVMQHYRTILRNVPMIDATGMYRLEEIVREFHKQGSLVCLTGYAPSVKVEISKTPIGEMAVLHPVLDFCIGDAKEKLQTSS